MIFSVMFYVGLVLFILFLIATVVLFFVLKIPKALGVVTGQTQKKAIEEIRSGGLKVTGRRTRLKESAILARDVEGKMADKNTSSKLKKGARPGLNRTSDASESLAEKAIQDAKEAVEKSEQNRKLQEAEESTEVLTYNEYQRSGNNVSGEEKTSVLEEEKSTDILEEDSTDVLTANGTVIRKDSLDETLASSQTKSDINGEDVTDVLRTTAVRPDQEYDNEIRLEGTKTDVLTEDMMNDLSQEDVYGVYNPEMTAVLKSEMAPNQDSISPRTKAADISGITVLYSETVIHTEESI